MTTLTRSLLQTEIINLVSQLADDWEYDGEIDANTGFFGDLGYESLDLVVLGAALQERYGKLPFSEFLAQLGEQEAPDCTIGMLAEFIVERMAPNGAREI